MHSKTIQEKVKKDYDEIAKEFSDTRRHSWKEFDQFLPYLRSAQNILDLGCGNGRLLNFLEKHHKFNYTGIDQSRELLKKAKELHPNAKFLEADISKPIKADKADIVFAIASFHHIPPRDQAQTLKNWNKLLKKDGHLLMTNWNLFQSRFWKSWLNLKRPSLFGLLIPWKNKVMRYYYAFTTRKLHKMLKEAGFEVMHMEVNMNIITIAKNANS